MAHRDPRETAHELRDAVRSHYREDVDKTHRSLLLAWLAFGLTFAITRGITYGIRHEILPNMNVASEGLHIHHYVWGIGLLMLAGYAFMVDDKARFHRPIAIAYGVGGALIIDEFALLLNLRDVYWLEEGRWSVDIALGIMVLFALYFSAVKFWGHLVRAVAVVLRRRPDGKQ